MAFLTQYGAIYLAAGCKISLAQILVEHPFVSAQVHIALHTVVENEYLAVAERIERTRIDVQIALQLNWSDL